MEKMPEVIKGFTHAEYLIVFIAIIYGYVGAEYFLGWGAMVRNRSQIKLYWLHILWTIFAFLMFIQNWYGIWPRTKFITLNIFYFLYSLVPIFIFHMISVLLFPKYDSNQTFDMRSYFSKNNRGLFLMFAVYFVITIISSLVYTDAGNVLLQNSLRGLGVILAASAAYFHTNQILHKVFLLIGFIALIGFMFAIPR